LSENFSYLFSVALPVLFEADNFFFISIFIRDLAANRPTSTQLKHLKGILPLYFHDPLLSFLKKLASSTYDSLSELSFILYSSVFIFFDALKVASFLDGFAWLCFLFSFHIQ
jgi:hypothetical protein